MGLGNKKPKEVKPATVQSAYKPAEQYTIDTGLGGYSRAALDGNNLSVTNTLPTAVREASLAAQNAINRGANYFSADPTQRARDTFEGRNPYFNVFKLQSDKNFESGLGQIGARFSRNGLSNSNVLGGAAAQLLSDKVLTDNQNALAALDYQNQLENQALQNAMGIYGGLSDISLQPLGMASNNLASGFGARDQLGMFNAGQIQNAAQFNAQQAAQARAARNAMWGNIIGAGLGLAGTAMTGGMGGGSMMGAGRSMGGFF